MQKTEGRGFFSPVLIFHLLSIFAKEASSSLSSVAWALRTGARKDRKVATKIRLEKEAKVGFMIPMADPDTREIEDKVVKAPSLEGISEDEGIAIWDGMGGLVGHLWLLVTKN